MEEQDEVPFKFRKVSEDVCPLVTLGAVLKEKKHNDCVSLHCYVNIEDRPLVPTTLRYQTKTINKKNVTCIDDTGTIKLTFWGSCIECIQESGVYFIQQVKIKEWPKGVISLTTTPSTCIKIYQNIQKSKSSLKEVISYTVKFPPNSIQLVNSEKNCLQCGRASDDHNCEGKLCKCMHCHAMTLAVNVPSRFVLKLEFTKEIGKSVTMYYQQIAQCFDYKKKPVPQDLNDLVFDMLSDSSTVLVIDSLMNCIGLKQG